VPFFTEADNYTPLQVLRCGGIVHCGCINPQGYFLEFHAQEVKFQYICGYLEGHANFIV
jgi:hypothetical protein